MSALPIFFNPQGGSAASRIADNGLDIKQPIIIVGNPGSDVLQAANTLQQTNGNQNYRVASQYLPYSLASQNIQELGVPASDPKNNLPTYAIIGGVVILAVLFFAIK